MRAAIDTMLRAVSNGTLHSRVGACDPRGFFAKRALHDDSQHALGSTSLRTGRPFPLPRSEKSGQSRATHCVKSVLLVFLTTGKDGEIVRHCRQPNRAVFGRGRRFFRWELLFASILRCPLEPACSSLPVRIRSGVARERSVRE
jgi:hypothetical protein